MTPHGVIFLFFPFFLKILSEIEFVHCTRNICKDAKMDT